MIIENGPLIPMKATEDGKTIPKKPNEFTLDDFKIMEQMSTLASKMSSLRMTLMDECDAINVENCVLKYVRYKLKKDARMLEKDKQELEHTNEILK